MFVQSGLNTALVQHKDTTEKDYSSVFWVSLIVEGIFYTVLFFVSPFIAAFYKMPNSTKVFRVLALVLIPGAFNSIQNAKVQKEIRYHDSVLYKKFIDAMAMYLLGDNSMIQVGKDYIER